MRIDWKHLAVALAVLPFAAVLVAWIGFFNVGASSGHWKITDWFLHFAMRSAVRTYALEVKPPERLPLAGIQPAAGHFARGCAICHGAPGEPRSPAVLQMLPQPPDLAGTVGEWSDAELFRIVKHGIRFTGMPAWPTQERDDEVWAMVAFLRALPTMDAAHYRNLAYGSGSTDPPRQDFESTLADCVRCHEADGRGRSSLTPIIAAQNESYLLASLRAYAEGRRPGGIMSLPTVAADRDTLSQLARHFAASPRPNAGAIDSDPALIERGEQIARGGIRARDVPACLGCHASDNRNPSYPVIAGQLAPYIEAQLRLFRAQQRGGTAFGHLMANAAKGLADADIAAAAAYFSSVARPLATTAR